MSKYALGIEALVTEELTIKRDDGVVEISYPLAEEFELVSRALKKL